jgi:biofilm PGA synthesis N-glycosyltransferase PgaC
VSAATAAERTALGCGALAGWVLGGYALALAALPPRRWRTEDREPLVTIVVPTHRERDLLAAKLRSLSAVDYPRERLEVVVVSDGDPELARIARATLPDALVLLQPERRGKPAALNRALEHATGDVVLLTDAHTHLAPDSLRVAVRHFADPSVLGVTGRWAETASVYDRYEHVLRLLETRSGSTAGVFGGLLAVRREHIGRFPEDVVNDDLWLLLRLVRAGGRVVYEPRATSLQAGLRSGPELERRARISAGRALLARELRDLPPAFAWRLVSHKFGRLGLPFALLGALVGSAAAGRRPAYRFATAVQLAGYGVGVLAIAGVHAPGPLRPVSHAAGQFVLGNVATTCGVIRALRGRQDVRWRPVR